MKKDILVLLITVLIICGFVLVLPYLSDIVKNAPANTDEPEEKPIPVSYYCERDVDTSLNAVIKQKATYKISNKLIKEALVIKEYTFKTEEDYLNFKKSVEENKKEVTGITETLKPDNLNLKYTITTNKKIDLIPEEDREYNFPKNYDNLLVYTKGQNCKATY